MDPTSEQPTPRRAPRRVANPPNPWHASWVEHLGPAPEARLEVYEDHARSALSRNRSPDVGFEFSVNPYRGCYHGCAYCYARPSHQHLDFGAGTDFDRKIVVKRGIAERLREAFDRPSWRGDLVVFSGNTDCYQPLEASLSLTRACLQVCLAYRNPVGIITKSTLIERDIELLARLSEDAHCAVNVSLAFDDPEVCRAMEPHTPSPGRRYKTIKRLADAGIPVGVMLAPIIPGLNDAELPRVLERAREAGAQWVGWGLLRLAPQVRVVFTERLRQMFPLRADRVLSQLAACRALGQVGESRFGHRMRGEGPRWESIARLLTARADRLGYGRAPAVPSPSPFRRPARDGDRRQLRLL